MGFFQIRLRKNLWWRQNIYRSSCWTYWKCAWNLNFYIYGFYHYSWASIRWIKSRRVQGVQSGIQGGYVRFSNTSYRILISFFFEKKFLMALIIFFLSIWQLPHRKERTQWLCEWLQDFRNSSMWGCLFGAGTPYSHFKGWKRMLQSRQRQMQTGWQKWRWRIPNLHEYLK